MSEDSWKSQIDQWLSPEAGKGPPEDDAWRKTSGFLRPFGTPDPAAAPSAAPVEGGRAGATEDWTSFNPDAYEQELQGFRDSMSAFRQRLMYSFPNMQSLDADQLTLAAGWLTDMEAQALEVRQRAFLFTVVGRGFLNEVDAALKELGQLKQAYASQRQRIEREQRERIAEINRQTEAHARQMREQRRQMWKETNEEIRRMHEDTMRRRREASERQHEEFLRYIRGEKVIGHIKIVD